MSFYDRQSRLRIRRSIRKRQRQIVDASEHTGAHIDKNFIGRLERLLVVKRFLSSWLVLLVIIATCTVLQGVSLSNYYQSTRPVPGGIYNEGTVGAYSNASPIFASNTVDTAVSRMIFAGLLKYNSNNQLVGDLASSYSVDQTGKHYTVKLKPNLTWQDGTPLTAKDVAFTYNLIKNPDVGSPLQASWQNITVSYTGKYTVKFDLVAAYSPFPYNLLTGIVPEHILKDVAKNKLRSTNFNTTHPVGAGPFAWQAIQSNGMTDPDKFVSLIALKPFAGYNGGEPKLDGFVLHAFGSRQAMISAFIDRDINAMTGLDKIPDSLKKPKDIVATSIPSTAATMAFFKTTSGVLMDTQVRQALVEGTDTVAIRQSLGYKTIAVDEPILQGQLSYDPSYKQTTYDSVAANLLLDNAGWVRGANGIRTKGGQQLAFRLYAEDTPENRLVAHKLESDWKALGVNVTTVIQPLADFQTSLQFHTYDALLYSISIGVDPDVFPYWDSAQADVRSTTRLNFSEYKSAIADSALESGRTRLDPQLRSVKYKPFLKAWQTDAPAVGLYQPRFLYITRGHVYGMNNKVLNTDSDRYYTVNNWEIRTQKITN